MSIAIGIDLGTTNSSVAYVKDGLLDLVLEEERLSHKKHDNQPFRASLED